MGRISDLGFRVKMTSGWHHLLSESYLAEAEAEESLASGGGRGARSESAHEKEPCHTFVLYFVRVENV